MRRICYDPLSSPLWVPTLVSTTKNWLLLHGGKVDTKGAWVLQIVVLFSREEVTLFFSPFHKIPEEDSYWLSSSYVPISDQLFVVRVRQSHGRTRQLLSNTWLDLGKNQFPEKGNTVLGEREGIGQKRLPICALNHNHRMPQYFENKIKLILIYSNFFKCLYACNIWRSGGAVKIQD